MLLVAGSKTRIEERRVRQGKDVRYKEEGLAADSERRGSWGVTMGKGLGAGFLCAIAAASAAAATSHEYWVPVVISRPGAMNTQWRSEAALVNTSCSAPASVQFLYYSGGATPVVREQTIAPSSQLVISDVVGGFLGASGTSGPLRVLSSQPLIIAGRVFNQTADGTLGQTMDGVEVGAGFAKGAVALLPSLRENGHFRTNVQLLNMSADTASLRIRFLGHGREAILNVPAPPRRLTHLQQPLLSALGAVDNAWAEVEVLEGEGIWPFASVVDNRTGDAVTITPVRGTATATTGWLPVVARTPGLAGTTWRTGLTVLNAGTTEATVDLVFRIEGQAEQTVAARVSARSQRSWEDLVQEVFGLDRGVGPLWFSASQPIVVVARVYNQTETGSFGQSSPVLEAGAGASMGDSILVPFLSQGPSRSNLDILNMGETSATVRVALFADGGAAGAFSSTLARRSRVRYDEILRRQVGLEAVENGFAVVSVEAGASVWAVGSVVDQRTGDPTTIQGRPLRVPAPPQANFTFSPASPAAGATVQFADRSSCFPHSWSWQFGSGGPLSSEARPRQTFPAPGTYPVRLTAANAAGTSSALVRSLEVAESVTARFVFRPSPTAVGTPVQFEDRSDGPVSEWRWEFGDGASSRERNPTHTFGRVGKFPVTLTVLGGGGTSTRVEDVEVRELVADFVYVPLYPRVGEPIQFEDRTLGTPTSRRWSFGDGSESSEPAPRHTFPGGGPYRVTLTVKKNGFEDSVSRRIVFVPDVSFTWQPRWPETGRDVVFSGTSTAPVNWWSWNYGDGSALGAGASSLYVFEEEGRFTVAATASNEAGAGWKGETVTVRGECKVPPAPQIFLAPAAGASCPYYVRWSPTSPHQSYELQESSTLDFTSTVVSFPVEGGNESPRLSHPTTADTTYYYRVRARAGDYCAGQWSPWSAVASVVVGPNHPCQVKLFSLPSGRSIEMVWIPPGTFQMGSPTTEAGRLADENLHQVTITRGFYLARHEVTQGVWREVVGSSPTRFPDCGENCPQDSISWYAACGLRSEVCGERGGFVAQLNQMLGLTGQSARFRLPSEAEWEYAARAGTTSAYGHSVSRGPTPRWPLRCDGACGGCPELDAQAWWCANSLDGTRTVMSKIANPWGLYDVHGSLAEWVEDWYSPYPAGPVVDPVGPRQGSYRVLRGGSWFNYARFVRSAIRFGDIPGFGDFSFGLRLAFGEPLPLAAQATEPSREAPYTPPPARLEEGGPPLPGPLAQLRRADQNR
ncbi:MAG: PKD domain-containing protein [Acidobacteriota bacterium]